MNCKQANEIIITECLYAFGIKPTKIIGDDYWYNSLTREEKTPSLKVNSRLNRWYDHGEGVGGKIVDLLIRVFQTDVADILIKLENKNFPSSLSFQKHTISIANKISIKKVGELKSKALLDYLSERAIDADGIVRQCCNEIHYNYANKNYFGIGFKNNLGGFEIRNKFFKGCVGSKSITTIERSGSKYVCLFEGFFDFISAYQAGGVITESTIIVLNSVTQIKKASAELHKNTPENGLAYFDNDEAGRKCFQILKSEFPSVQDHSSLYNGFKDLNEMIINLKMI